MWEKPWGYKEGIVTGAGLAAIGLLLQTVIGPVEWEVFSFPVNVMVLTAYMIVLAVMHILRGKVYLFRWLSLPCAAVPALAWVVVFTVIMGLTRQMPSSNRPADIFGFSMMVSSWAFVLLYVWMVTVLGLTVIRVLVGRNRHKAAFLLQHFGLFAAMVSATLGSADMQRLTMTTKIGEPQWLAEDGHGNMRELPLAVELEDFRIDEYPPKLMLIDNESGQALPENAPAHILIEEGTTSGILADWQLSVEQTLPMAAAVNTSDTTKFTEFHSMGATYAAYVRAVNTQTGENAEGWVSCGSFIFPYKALWLDGKASLVMPDREPQRFVSAVTVYTRSGQIRKDSIEVNKPMSIDGWKIYQLGYDETKGRWSDVSIFELVRDPWLYIVYSGIAMMVLGAALLFVNAQKKGKERKK